MSLNAVACGAAGLAGRDAAAEAAEGICGLVENQRLNLWVTRLVWHSRVRRQFSGGTHVPQVDK